MQQKQNSEIWLCPLCSKSLLQWVSYMLVCAWVLLWAKCVHLSVCVPIPCGFLWCYWGNWMCDAHQKSPLAPGECSFNPSMPLWKAQPRVRLILSTGKHQMVPCSLHHSLCLFIPLQHQRKAQKHVMTWPYTCIQPCTVFWVNNSESCWFIFFSVVIIFSGLKELIVLSWGYNSSGASTQKCPWWMETTSSPAVSSCALCITSTFARVRAWCSKLLSDTPRLTPRASRLEIQCPSYFGSLLPQNIDDFWIRFRHKINVVGLRKWSVTLGFKSLGLNSGLQDEGHVCVCLCACACVCMHPSIPTSVPPGELQPCVSFPSILSFILSELN